MKGRENMRVSFCEQNEASGKVKDLIKKHHPNFEVTVNKCIGSCNDCFGSFIARVEGELLVAETGEELYDKIIKYYV